MKKRTQKKIHLRLKLQLRSFRVDTRNSSNISIDYIKKAIS